MPSSAGPCGWGKRRQHQSRRCWASAIPAGWCSAMVEARASKVEIPSELSLRSRVRYCIGAAQAMTERVVASKLFVHATPFTDLRAYQLSRGVDLGIWDPKRVREGSNYQ